MFDFSYIKNKMIDFLSYIRRNTSIIFYIFLGVIIIAYASLYVYKTNFSSEVTTVTEEQKYKEVMVNNNTFKMVENLYNPNTEFYVGKFIISNRNSNAPLIANETLKVEGIAKLKNNKLQELNINPKQITPSFFVVEIENLPAAHLELRLDFKLKSIEVGKESNQDVESLYTFISDNEMNKNLTSLPIETYKQESIAFEIENVNNQIEDMSDRIDYYETQIEILKEQIEDNEEELNLMTNVEKKEMESTIEGHKAEINSYKKEIEKVEDQIAEREEKKDILEAHS